MVSAVITWKGVTKPFFVGGTGLKGNGCAYLKHLKKDLIPAVEMLYPRNDFHFVQDSASSHRSKIVQAFLKDRLKSRFVKSSEWPPRSPDCNPLDYFFWNKVQEKVYQGRHCKPFKDANELKRRICQVWPECACDLKTIRKALKQFLLRLKAVERKNGHLIKTEFG